MTRERSVRDRPCAANYGMAATYYGDTGPTDWLRDTARREYRYNPRGL